MSVKKYTLESLRLLAANYQTRTEFRSAHPSAEVVARRLGVMDEICAHMPYLITYWSDDMLNAEALKYETRGAFAKGNFKAYDRARARGILDKICGHMVDGHDWYSAEEVISLAAKFKTKNAFRIAHEAAYNAARRLGVRDIAFAHMPNAVRGFDTTKPGTLYYLRVNASWLSSPLYKVGITNLDVKKRYIGEKSSITIIMQVTYQKGVVAAIKEQDIILKNRQYLYSGDRVFKYTKNTELFTHDILGLDQDLAA